MTSDPDLWRDRLPPSTRAGPGPSPANGVTLWRRIADEIEQAILRGDVTGGERLPGEQEIAEQFGVNRHTVRRALAELTDRGLVRAERGSGTYVEPSRLAYPIKSRTRFSEIIGEAGRAASGSLLSSIVIPASREIARRLAIPEGAMVMRLELLRSANRVPICLASTWLLADHVPHAARTYRSARSVSKLLAAAGYPEYHRKETRISAAVADAMHGARLRLAPGRPLIVVDSIDVTPDGRPIITTHARFAADRVEVVVES